MWRLLVGVLAAAVLLFTAAVSSTRTRDPSVSVAAKPAVADTACQIQVAPIGRILPPDIRAKSPLDSVTFQVAGTPVKLCYGRPSSRGRTMLGGRDVPYGVVWRTGANEPTTINTPVALTIAGIKTPPGIYSLYTIPGETEWEIIVNKSTSQWGLEYNKVQDQDLGRSRVTSERLATPIETLVIRPDPTSGEATAIVLEWERTRVRIPITAG